MVVYLAPSQYHPLTAITDVVTEYCVVVKKLGVVGVVRSRSRVQPPDDSVKGRAAWHRGGPTGVLSVAQPCGQDHTPAH